MAKILFGILIFLNSIRCIPHLLLFYLHKNRKVVQSDTRNWLKQMNKDYSLYIGFIFLLAFHKQFRNLFYYRIGHFNFIMNTLCPKLSSLLLETKNIGEGFYLEHGFSTAVGAKSIGKNCTIFHNTTIGAGQTDDERPVLMDNVIVRTGAVLFGDITIGNNVVIGVNAIVSRDVPDNSTVFSSPSKVMKWSPGG